MQATHKISAVYFPSSGEVELTIEDIDTGELVYFTAPVNEKIGKAISKVVPACVYVGAVITTTEEEN